MRKYTAAFLVFFTFNLCSPSTENSNVVVLNDYEKLLRDRVINWGSNSVFRSPSVQRMLLVGCGISEINKNDSYDISVYPECPEVLDFLKRLDQNIRTFEKEAQQLNQKIYNAIDARTEERLKEADKKDQP